ncbi:MAG: beta-lactamase family protein [Lachnospiraceae bacterium]|nr:beta-lactamase family protein [Lachnospiraceae bacterium]
MDRTSRFQEMMDFLDSFLEMGTPGFDCIVYHQGVCVCRHMRGYRDYGNTQKMTGTELYNIYSLSKPITCTAALMLMEKGAFGLDDLLCEYLPEFTEMYVKADGGGEAALPAQNPIRIRDLFCMTAGFSYDLQSEQLKRGRVETNGVCPAREMMRYLAREPLAFEPGTQWRYSFCHDVLAVLVEVLSGMQFSAFAQKYIFDPLQMKHSTFDTSTVDMDKLMAQYRYDTDKKCLINCGRGNQGFKLGSAYESGGAGCISSVDDYIRFAEALRKGNVLLNTETSRMMWSNQLNEQCLSTFSQDRVRDYGYGLGVRCPQMYSTKKDFGWGGAGGAFLAISPECSYSLLYVQHVLDSPVQAVKGELVKFLDGAFA